MIPRRSGRRGAPGPSRRTSPRPTRRELHRGGAGIWSIASIIGIRLSDGNRTIRKYFLIVCLCEITDGFISPVVPPPRKACEYRCGDDVGVVTKSLECVPMVV